jgi:hypothetical protein
VKRFIWALTASAALIVGVGSVAEGQATAAGAPRIAADGTNAARTAAPRATIPADSSRSYDAQALRFETNWGNVKIIRGINGPAIGTSGWFRDFDLERLLARSPAAVTEVRAYNTANSRGSFIGVAGAVTTAVGIAVMANGSNNAASPILVIGGVSAMVWGAQHLSTSYSALSRALWWYNRDLTR